MSSVGALPPSKGLTYFCFESDSGPTLVVSGFATVVFVGLFALPQFPLFAHHEFCDNLSYHCNHSSILCLDNMGGRGGCAYEGADVSQV